MRKRHVHVSLLCGALSACTGHLGGDSSPNSSGLKVTDEVAQEVGTTGMRRLSVDEYKSTVSDLVGIDLATAREVLPVDSMVPFDNDYTLQTPSEALIKGAEMLAGDLADAVVADPTLRSRAVGCEPQSAATDDVCFRSFVTQFGRRALRRPLAPAEIDRFASLAQVGTDAGDFWTGVNAALRAFLQHPEFLYRVELGEAVADHPGLFALSDYEIGTRLSYFLLGTTPPDWLLDAGAAGQLKTKEGVTAAASKLFQDDRARARMARFHSMWLSYSELSKTGLSGQMHDETDALLNRVIFDEKRPWVDVLTSKETWVTPELAAHYGLASPGASAGWVSYGDSGRKGILSQGTFLSAVSKFGDTSPTQRGLLVRTRLFCESIAKPDPSLMVNVDKPPMSADANACKKQRYYMSTTPGCASCHTLMDPIGFGLERYDATGAFRDTQPNRPDCPIDGEGEFVGEGTFNGAGQLADLAVASGQLEDCVARQIYRFAIGRTTLDEHDEAIMTRVVADISKGQGLHVDELIMDYVGSDAFRVRRAEVTQ